MRCQRTCAGLGIVVLGMLGACATGTRLPREQLSDPGALLFSGYVHDQVECYKCHNGDALGTWQAPNLRDLEFVATEDELLKTIRKGTFFRMPAYSELLTDEEAGQILTWLSGLSGGQAEEPK